MIVGTAGWSIPTALAADFPGEGTHLARYARRFRGVEINSSFYRPHRPATYERWAASAAPSFRFAVKMPRTITHEHALSGVDEALPAFLDQARSLGTCLGPLLVQLAPGLAFDRAVASRFFALLRRQHAGEVVLEPRHPSWFSPDVNAMLKDHAVSGVATDPAKVPTAGEPWGDTGLVYYRLHGSPVIYRSSYDDTYLARLAANLHAWRARGASAWCIFDNTARGAAAANALTLDGLYSSAAGIAGMHITNT